MLTEMLKVSKWAHIDTGLDVYFVSIMSRITGSRKTKTGAIMMESADQKMTA